MKISHVEKLREELGEEGYKMFIGPIQQEYAYYQAQDANDRSVQKLTSVFSAAVSVIIAHEYTHGALQAGEAAAIQGAVVVFAYWIHKCLHQDRLYNLQSMEKAQARLATIIPEEFRLLQNSIERELGMDSDPAGNLDDLKQQKTSAIVKSWVERLGPFVAGLFS